MTADELRIIVVAFLVVYVGAAMLLARHGRL